MQFRRWLEAAEPSPTAVTVLTNRGRALILRRGPTAPWMPGAWNLPGGGIDEGETPEQAAARECAEEAGIAPLGLRPVRKVADPDLTLYVFTAETNVTVPRLNYESDAYAWVGPEDVDKYRFVPHVADAILSVIR